LAAGIADGRRSTQWCGGRVGFWRDLARMVGDVRHHAAISGFCPCNKTT
jgi:hypothetical protein